MQTISETEKIQPSVGFLNQIHGQVYGVEIDADAILGMQLSIADKRTKSIPDEPVKSPVKLPGKLAVTLIVQASVKAHIHCYYRQSNNGMYRIFPGVFNRDTQVKPGFELEIPTASSFRDSALADGKAESYLCLASSGNLEMALPRSIRTAGYNPLPYRNFDELYQVYRGVADANLVGRVISARIE